MVMILNHECGLKITIPCTSHGNDSNKLKIPSPCTSHGNDSKPPMWSKDYQSLYKSL